MRPMEIIGMYSREIVSSFFWKISQERRREEGRFLKALVVERDSSPRKIDRGRANGRGELREETLFFDSPLHN